MDVSPSPVSWSRIAAFVRQLGHDIRNDLNALSLEAALLKELVSDPEAVTSATRIQAQLRDIANRLKELSGRFVLPEAKPAPISVAELMGHLQNGLSAEGVEWKGDSTTGQVHTDPVLLAKAVKELIQNAIQHAGLHKKPEVHLTSNGSAGTVLTIREQGSEEYSWPESPFETPRAAHYGIGIPLAAAILAGLGVKVERSRNGDALETRLVIPKA